MTDYSLAIRQSTSFVDYNNEESPHDQTRRTDFSKRRSYKSLRKTSRRKSTTAQPGPGIGARRNKRFSW